MAEEIYIELPDGRCLHGIMDIPATVLTSRYDGVLAVCVHGFPMNMSGAGGIFDELSGHFHESRLATLRFDLGNCGKSDGQGVDFTLSQARDDIESVLLWAEKQGYGRIILLAEGLGALFLTCATMRPAVKACAMLWPALDTDYIYETIFNVRGQKDVLAKNGFILYDGKAVGQKFLDALRALDAHTPIRNFALPTLVLQGEKDEIVPVSQIEIIRKDLGSKRIDITIFDDGTHGLPEQNHRKAAATHILHFIDRFAHK